MVIAYTGQGKGKTTAALGAALRACGHGWKVKMIQFIKGDWVSAEVEAARRLTPLFEIVPAGAGFVEVAQGYLPKEAHRQAARQAIDLALQAMVQEGLNLLILDEIFNCLVLGLITDAQVQELLDRRPQSLHLILTGRGAPDWLIERCDLVTEMREIKHPFAKGAPAVPGIDY